MCKQFFCKLVEFCVFHFTGSSVNHLFFAKFWKISILECGSRLFTILKACIVYHVDHKNQSKKSNGRTSNHLFYNFRGWGTIPLLKIFRKSACYFSLPHLLSVVSSCILEFMGAQRKKNNSQKIVKHFVNWLWKKQ